MSEHYHYGYADEYHSHPGLEGLVGGLREDLGRAEERIRWLEERLAKSDQVMSVYGETLDDLRNRVYALEHGEAPSRVRPYVNRGDGEFLP